MKLKLQSILKIFKNNNPLRKNKLNNGAFPAGHYYSPIPDKEEISLNLDLNNTAPLEININKESQYKLLQEYHQFYLETKFPMKQQSDFRYYSDQSWFSYTDAFFLHSFLRKHKPKKIVEVGSGFSSAIMLDTIERYVSNKTEITFIEPNPDRLLSLLRENDKEICRVLISKVQKTPLELFTTLGENDLLLIDSSHVLKYGNDLQFILFEIIPRIAPGVFVHFHDIFYPFEYPYTWLEKGRYWNEIYFLRAFLAYNSQWKIYCFNSYIKIAFKDYLSEKMPMCHNTAGGSLYIQKLIKD